MLTSGVSVGVIQCEHTSNRGERQSCRESSRIDLFVLTEENISCRKGKMEQSQGWKKQSKTLERFHLQCFIETGCCVSRPAAISGFLKSLFPFPLPTLSPNMSPALMKLEFSSITGHQTDWVKDNECRSDEH